MNLRIKLIYFFLVLTAFNPFAGCKNHTPPAKHEIVKTTAEIDDQLPDNLKSLLQYANDSDGNISDSVRLFLPHVLSAFYEQNSYKSIWSKKGNWLPLADSMFKFIKQSRYYGLYPNDYHFKEIATLRKKYKEDSLAKRDVVFWTKADLLLSDAFMRTIKDLKEGRLLPDSISIVNNKSLIDSLFVNGLKKAISTNSIVSFFNSTEPSDLNYNSLKEVMKSFVDSMDTTEFTYINYPQKDSLHFIKSLQQRLSEAGVTHNNIPVPDSLMLSGEIKIFQHKHGLKQDGKITGKLIKLLNATDAEKFKRIAITLDRYKRLTTLPSIYIWVNLPGYYLKLWNQDSVVLESKVIVGKPSTRTPVLTSSISDMVIYPQWTIPESIIKKDILPALKKDPGYLEKKGFNLVDLNDENINPYTVNWQKYSNGIPWKIRQGSGDDNALGIFKFNFNNSYNVYLHDTNQRYLFKNSSRALSHGCVRVQKWQELAYFIARNDSLNLQEGERLAYNEDSIKNWVAAKSRKHIILKSKLPLYIKYFTCEAKGGKLVMYDDIYNDDKIYADKYFANK